METPKVPQSPASSPILGRVKWFNSRRGFGFLTPLDFETLKQDVFFHQTEIQLPGRYRVLENGQLVNFQTRPSERGLVACKVRKVEAEEFRVECADKGVDFEVHFRETAVPRIKLIKCFNCGKFGHHRASRCHADAQGSTSPQVSSPKVLESGVEVSKDLDGSQVEPVNVEPTKRCYNCRSVFHLAADCPKVNCPEAKEAEKNEQTRKGKPIHYGRRQWIKKPSKTE